MSLQAVLWALDGAGPTPAPQKLVLIALADFVNDQDGTCWPSQEVIAQRATMSARTVRRHIGWLDGVGLISVHGDADGSQGCFECQLNCDLAWYGGPEPYPRPASTAGACGDG